MHELLADLSRNDLSGLILTEVLSTRYQQSLYLGGTMSIVGAEKQGNAMYVGLLTEIPTLDQSISSEHKIITINEEYFFFGSKGGGILVKISIPSENLRNGEAYRWVEKWLASLRVLID